MLRKGDKMKFVIAQPCVCKEHAKEEGGFMYLGDEKGHLKFDSRGQAQRLIDDFAEHEGLCDEHKNKMAVIPEAEVIED